MPGEPDIRAVTDYLKTLQDGICDALGALEPAAGFGVDGWEHPSGGGGISRVLENGSVIEKGGVNFSHVKGAALPPSASQSRPEIAGLPFEATGVSVVIHPFSPLVPTCHMNVRFFCAGAGTERTAWWFGGGYDLTPYYGFVDDCVHWHRTARDACNAFGPGIYAKLKRQCDEYFFIAHRNEPRGIGGIFFDDWNRDGFEQSFGFLRAVGDSFLSAYLPIMQKRKEMPWTPAQRAFQAYRRGRYVEFNLVYDRGTLFGLQSGGRTESVLMSLPPGVRWPYRYEASPGSEEERLTGYFLVPRDWACLPPSGSGRSGDF